MNAAMTHWVKRYGWCFVFLLPVLIFLPGIGGFTFIQGTSFNDIAISHYPMAVYIQTAIRETGQIPLWSNTILSGFPLAANPLASLFYPPQWLALLLPLPFGLNLVAILHMMFGGVGMYRLMRQEGVSGAAALMGAVAFEAMPKLATHWAAGHLTLVYAVSWTPWLLLAERKTRQKGAFWQLLPGAVLGAIALADPRWLIPAGLLWVGYRFLADKWQGWRTLAIKMGWSAACGVLAAGLAASLLLPLLEYSRLSSRSAMGTEDVLAYSLPPERLLGLIIPDSGSSVEGVVYPGVLVLACVLFAVWLPPARRKSVFWLGTALFGVLYALGEAMPGMNLLAQLPGFNMVRVPARMIFLTGMGLAAALAWVAHTFIEARGEGIRLGKWNPNLALTGLAAIVVLLGVAVGLASGEFPWRFAWSGAGLVLAMIWIGRAIKRPVGSGWVGLGIAFLMIDLCGVSLTGLAFESKQAVTQAGDAIVQLMKAQSAPLGLFRVYSPSYSIPQQVAVVNGLELADGVDPLQLMEYVNFMERATGVQRAGYSVTMPPFASGDPAEANRLAVPDARLLGLLNVAFVAAEFDVNAEGLELIDRVGDTRVYRNRFVQPRAWVQSADSALGEGASRPVSMKKTANTIEIQAEGPGLLVVSEMTYPGWKLRVDGESRELTVVDDLLRGVELDAGAHVVEMVFRPTSVYAGIVISLAFLAGMIALWVGRRK